MADFQKLNVNGTDYNVKDATARQNASNAQNSANNAQTSAENAMDVANNALDLANSINMTYTASTETITFTKSAVQTLSIDDVVGGLTNG